MSNTSILLRPKKWFRISNYIASVCGLFLFAYIINQVLFNENADPTFIQYLLIGVSVIGIVAALFTIFTQHRHQIVVSDDRISKHGFMNREIEYSEIDKVVIRNGGVEVHGEGFLETISFGDLHQNYKKARDFLSEKLSDEFHIEVKGRDKFVEQFLASDS
ncbi:MAG TPA: hypothetical protein DD671_03150 [Balneolaceae bacterium]|nr:hypothetical protein [Balneolaceae bacterium]